MPLLYVISVDYYSNLFTVALCWLDQEVIENYNKAIQHVRKLFREGIWLLVVATNAKLALISVVKKHFPAIKAKRVLCFWHIAKIMLTNYKALFPTIER
jgi:hypothetical protein